jgi:DNA-binding response OmpR family regulator
MVTPTQTHCTCCGQPFPAAYHGVLCLDNIVTRGGFPAPIKLTQLEADIFTALNKRFSRAVSSDAIIGVIYSTRYEPEYPLWTVRVRISSLRRKIAPLGLVIITTHGVGYTLAAVPPKEVSNASPASQLPLAHHSV